MSGPDIEALFESIVLNTHLQIVMTEAESGLVVFANSAWIRAQGGTQKSDVVGKTVAELGIWPSESARAEWRGRLLADNVATRRFDFTREDGSTGGSILFSQVIRVPEGAYFMPYNIDISDIVQAEELAIARLNRAQEIGRIGDFVYSQSTGLITGSNQFGKILDIDPVSGIKTSELLDYRIHPEDVEYVRDILNSDPETFSYQHRYLRGNDIVWLEWIGTVIRDENRVMRAWEGTVQDITTRKVIELEQDELKQKMQEAQRLESLGLLAGGVAHDFNNLLVGVLGNADLAMIEEDVPEPVRERLGDIITTAERAAELTNQLLAYSGKGKFVIQNTNISEIVREMSELLNVSITRRAQLRLYLDDSLQPIEADRTQLRQIIMNLIMNASEAIEHDNGVISVTTGMQVCSPDYLQAAELEEALTPGLYVYVEVNDNGHGMSEEVLDNLFEPFFTTKFSGRGLGMSAVMGIVRGHKGAVKIYTESGRGTTFKVFFPAVDGDITDEPESPQISIPTADNQEILIIDDDPLVLDLLERALCGMGFDVLTANNGAEGLEVFTANSSVNLVLLDLTMPELDGESTFRQMRQLRPETKAVLMSGYNEQEATQKLAGRGLAGFLQKPFRMVDLARVMREVL